MIHEYQRQSLEQLITQRTATPRSAATVFNENQTPWQTPGFSQSQVSLWLVSLPQSNHLEGPTTATYRVVPDIVAHLVSLLHQAGGRMPLARVLEKLPVDITTNEQQIRKLIQEHTQIEIKGPLLVLINQPAFVITIGCIKGF